MREGQDQPRVDDTSRSDGDDLARLMGEEQRERRTKPQRGESSLAERARQEAARAVEEAEQAVLEAAAVIPESEPAPTTGAAVPVAAHVEVPPSLRRQLRALQIALIVSVLVGIVAMTWPDHGTATIGADPGVAGIAGPAGRASALPDTGIQADPYYQAALSAGLDGEFRLAADHLQRAMQRHPAMEPAVEQLVHAHLAYYLRKSGQLSSAMKHDRLSRAGSQRAFLGDELWQSARAAEQRGDGREARRAYARFLMQSDALSPELRQLVGEAWMGLGDSYELQIRTAEPLDSSELEAAMRGGPTGSGVTSDPIGDGPELVEHGGGR